MALARNAHALLLDPEEFSCMLCLLGDGGIDKVAECALEQYESVHRSLALLDHQDLRGEGVTVHIQVFNAVTDLGRRTVLQFFPSDWNESHRSERRKSIVRLMNKQCPGTSLSRHNRETLLTAIKRGGDRPPPTFVQRLQREGLLPPDMTLSGAESVEDVVRTVPLARKAVARVLGTYLDVPYIDVEDQLPREHARLFERDQILSWEAIPCAVEDDHVVVAMADPTDSETIARIQEHLGKPIKVRVAAATDIRVAVDKIFKSR